MNNMIFNSLLYYSISLNKAKKNDNRQINLICDLLLSYSSHAECYQQILTFMMDIWVLVFIQFLQFLINVGGSDVEFYLVFLFGIA